MKTFSKITILVLIVIITQTSCEKILFGESQTNNTVIFEQIWQHIDDYYCCHEFVSVDWDSIYQVYSERVDDDMQSAVFLVLMDEMLQHLQDPRVGLVTNSGEFYYEDTTQYATNLDTNTVKFYNPTYGTVTIDGIAYVNRDIGWSDNYSGVIREMPKGLIIDLRGMDEETQSKGTDSNLGLFINSDNQVVIGSALEKIGPGEDNFASRPFSLWGPGFAYQEKYENPVVVLINRKVAAQWTTLAFRLSNLPNVTLMGDRTNGHTNNKSRSCYLLSNGWFLSCSSLALLDLSDNCVSCSGIEPDIPENDDPATTDMDEIIEAALQFLN